MSMNDKLIQFEKTKSVVRQSLIGMKFYSAHKALDFGLQHHTGTRKDKLTPEFQHQIDQMLYAKTLINEFLMPEETLATIALHDVVEDCNVNIDDIYKKFGPNVGKAVELMTNQLMKHGQVSGVKIQKDIYYGQMVNNPIASLCKGIDRFHNHHSMPGVFSKEKMRSYVAETEEYIVPMLRSAMKVFPEQHNAYWNIISVLKTQIHIVKMCTGE